MNNTQVLNGVERLLVETELQKKLEGKRCALVGHPASVTRKLVHSLDALCHCPAINITAAFGPQHGMRGDKQDNMIESEDFLDPIHNIPIFSLYGDVRRPTDKMMDTFDVLLFDVQDLGCRIYTYITTLLYLMEACEAHNKTLWVLDRPNPAGRPVEGTILESGWESFVGASQLIMRHGLTTGEMALWFKPRHTPKLDMEVIAMQGYDPSQGPGFGWPDNYYCWVNPSPNASSVNMARCFPGTVLIEGATLSEGRGTTIPLEVIGAPDIDASKILEKMQQWQPEWLKGALLRPCFFEPTFHKHQGSTCQGLQIHTDHADYDPNQFKPYRITLLMLKTIRLLYPDYDLWRHHAYEYEQDKLPIDLINGGPFVREWVDDSNAEAGDLEKRFTRDEQLWLEQINDGILLY